MRERGGVKKNVIKMFQRKKIKSEEKSAKKDSEKNIS